MADRQVSVVIPTYNRAEYLPAAIESVLGQPETCEVIVVDDGSTDETSEVLAMFPSVVVHKTPNIERGAARNLGALTARFGLIAFLDSDDAWAPDKLAIQLSVEGRPSVTGVRFIDAHGEATGRTYVAPPDSWDRLPYVNQYLATPSSLLISAEVFREAGGFPERRELQGSEDWVFLNRLRQLGTPIAVIPELLTLYRSHPGNSTGQLDKVAVCMWEAAEEIAAGAGGRVDKKRVTSRTAGSIARQYARAGVWREARRWLEIALQEGRAADRVWASWAAGTSGAKFLLSGRRQT